MCPPSTNPPVYLIEIPEELEGYLRFVATTGDTVFKWPLIQHLYREKLHSVITEFYESTASIADLPHYPNVDPFNFDVMKKILMDRMDSFSSAPFTVQRISELLTEPRKQYSRLDKFMRAIEKNILVVSSIEPRRRRNESENGESLDSTLSMNGDILSDLDIGVENDHGALNSHDTKHDDLSKLDGADPLEDDVPLDKLEPEVSVFTPEGETLTPDIDDKVDEEPRTSTPEADAVELPPQSEEEEIIDTSPALDEPEKPAEDQPAAEVEPESSEALPISSPSKRAIEEDATEEEGSQELESTSKRPKFDDEPEAEAATVVETAEVLEPIIETIVEPVVIEEISELEAPAETEEATPVTEPLIITEPTVETIIEEVPEVVESPYEAPLIDIPLTATEDASTTDLVTEPPSDDLIGMIETPILEQLQSTVTNPPIDPVRLPPIESIIPTEPNNGLALETAQSMEVAKVDDDLMKVDAPAAVATVAVAGAVENKMQTDEDEAAVASAMDVDESSADFMDQ